MKRIIALVLSLALVVGLGFGIQVKPAKADDTVDSWYITVTPKMKSIKLKAKEEHRINKGHYWIFSNELEKVDTSLKAGSIVRVLDSKEQILGTAFLIRTV